MPAPHVERLSTILVASEAVEGTDALQALIPATRGPKAIEVINFTAAPESTPLVRQVQSSHMDSRGFVNSQVVMGAEFEIELKGIGVGATAGAGALRIDPILRSAGMIPTYVTGPPAHVIYNMTSDMFSTAGFAAAPTLDVWGDMNGLLYKLVGGRCNIAGVCGLDSYPRLRIRALGGLPALPDSAPAVTDGITDYNTGGSPLITTVTYQGDTISPVTYAGITFTSHTYAADITQLTWDLNNQLTPRRTVQVANGVRSVFIQNRGVTGSIDPEAVLRADHDFWRKWRNHTTGVITTTFGTGFNEIAINFPTTQYRIPKPGARDGLRTLDTEFEATGTGAGNNSISIRFGSVA